jgi:hypothetical protein
MELPYLQQVGIMDLDGNGSRTLIQHQPFDMGVTKQTTNPNE